jgi:hypothetical protein
MTVERGQCRGCVTADNWFVVSGGSRRNKALSSCEAYDIITNSWRPMPSMRVERIHHSTCCIGNDVLVIGGRQGAWGDNSLDDLAAVSAEYYDSDVGVWFVLPTELPYRLADMVATPY